MLKIHFDFETRSACDLRKEALYRYASDPTTDVTMASYAIGDGPVQRWRPGDAYPFHSLSEPFQILAWNAGFERAIWDYVCTNVYGWPALELERFVCVAATSRANALPGKLEHAARCLKLQQKKDMAGHRLMLKMCKPKEIHDDGTIEWFEDPADIDRMHDYCDDDVRTERDIYSVLRPLTERELQAYWDNEYINDRGLPVDLDFAKSATGYAAVERDYITQRLHQLTRGKITTPRQFQRVKDWLDERISDDVRAVMKVYVKGEPKQKFDAAVRHNLLAMNDEAPGFLCDDVRELTEIIHEGGNSSISKYQSMLNRELHGAVHGLFMAFGAGQTGRYSSIGLQVHNLKRDVLAETDKAIREFNEGDPTTDSHWNDRIDERAGEVGGIISALSLLLRPTFIAEKDWLVWSDWSAIEARALPWLANSRGAKKKLEIFREIDENPDAEDVYVRNARAIGLYTDDGKPDRQIGKVAELSLGYGGGVGAFFAMARNYGVHVDEATAVRIRNGWRDANSWAVKFWADLERAAMSAIKRPGTPYDAGRVTYMFTEGTHNGLNTLWCKLPSGRVIAYPDARIEQVDTPWGEKRPGITAIKGNWHPKADEDVWPRFKVWSGLLAENVTQAVCADLLIDILMISLDEGLDVRAHTHDEVLIEAKDPHAAMQKLNTIMETNPPWASGLPLKAESGFGKRYKGKD